jgi:AraC-like DNA-binding protein
MPEINLAKETFYRSIPYKVYLKSIGSTVEHTHDYMQIWYVLSGSCEHVINNSPMPLTRGDIFVLPPFVNHQISRINESCVEIIGCEFLTSFISEDVLNYGKWVFLFDFTYIEPFLVSNEKVKPRLHLSGKVQTKVEELMGSMLHEYENELKYYEINIKADLLKLLAIIAREYDKNDDAENGDLIEKYRESVNKAIDFINNNYTQKIYIEDVSKIAMTSQTYFCYIFKQITGKTVIEYINSLRMNKIIDLLRNSTKSISEICFECGFNDLAYFNKSFKKETGISPRSFRVMSRPIK